MADRQRILLIDASPYIFRSYFALPSSIQTPAGEPNHAAHGFASFLIKIFGEEQPTHVGVAFDGSLTTSFRNEIYPEYKANRDLPPDSLTSQLDRCREIAEALGAHTAISDRFEADDLIASWLERFTQQISGRVSVVSSDKDLGQLVGESVDLYDFAKSTRWTTSTVEQKFGVAPSQLTNYQALAGDSVDNIPGVKGVGPKTAAALVQAFGGVEAILNDLDAVASSGLRGAAGLAKKLSAQADAARLSLQLATLYGQAEVADDLEELRWQGAREPDWSDLCERYGFTSMQARGLELESPS